MRESRTGRTDQASRAVRRYRYVVPWALAGAVGATVVTPATSSGSYVDPGTLNFIHMSDAGDVITNFDFPNQTWSNYNVAWPVTLVFYHMATINGVKSHMEDAGWQYYIGNEETTYLADTGGKGYWDTDSGVKNCRYFFYFNCSEDVHYRLYADADDYMNDPTWGNYVIGTTHFDEDESCTCAYYGWSEDAEHAVIQGAQQTWGQAKAANDVIPMYNSVYGWADGQTVHYFQSDGWAGGVYIEAS